MATITISQKTSAAFYGKITLGELRQFLRACEGVADTAPVTITAYDSQREGSSATITVDGLAHQAQPSPYDR